MAKSRVPLSFDVIGSREKAVAIVHIPEELKGREKDIAYSIMEKNKRVKSVLEKLGEREGKFRLRKYRLLVGDEDMEVIHKEYGYMLKLDPQKVYFSPREATERQRIASQVKDEEVVIVMFSGVAPYAIAIAKNSGVEKIITVEINPVAVSYARANIRMNKLSQKIVVVEGDVRTVCEQWYEVCDRVVMPLPKGAGNFLDIAVKCVKPTGGIIHFYSWGRKPDLFEDAELEIHNGLAKMDRKYEIISRRVVLPYSPATYKICIEFKVAAR